jgi:hypothetical protein
MILFFVDNDDGETTMLMHIDEEFFYYISNYLKLDVQLTKDKKPFGIITPSELRQKILDLPHEWLLQQQEKKQYLNGKEIIVKTKFTEKYIRELKSDFLRMAKLAEKKKVLIRWE